jgi:hypothetical protein
MSASKATTVSNAVNWGLQRIDQPKLPLSSEFRHEPDGTGVNIYVIDTGVLGTAEDFIDAEGNSRVTYSRRFLHRHSTASEEFSVRNL